MRCSTRSCCSNRGVATSVSRNALIADWFNSIQDDKKNRDTCGCNKCNWNQGCSCNSCNDWNNSCGCNNWNCGCGNTMPEIKNINQTITIPDLGSIDSASVTATSVTPIGCGCNGARGVRVNYTIAVNYISCACPGTQGTSKTATVNGSVTFAGCFGTVPSIANVVIGNPPFIQTCGNRVNISTSITLN